MNKHPLLIAQDSFNTLLKIHERLYNNILEVEDDPDQLRKVLIPLVIIVKKQCRALDKLEKHDRLCMRMIDRCRELEADPYYQQDHYIQHTTNLMSIEHWKKKIVGHLLSCCILAEKKGIRYTENEARTMLSLSRKDWDWLTEDGDYEMGFFLAAAHNEPLSLYAAEYMIDFKNQIPGNQPAKEKIADFYGGIRP